MKRVYLLALLLLAVVLAVLQFNKRPAQIRVEVDRNVIVKSNFDFIPEHWREPRLEQLAREESFPRIAAADQIGYYLALCDWVHQQWPASNPDPYPLCNAVDILRDIRAGKTGGFCGQYAYVLADVLKAAGYFSVRYVELWSNAENNQSHFVVEAWCDQYAKWVVLDPYDDLWYELKDTGVPASAFEVRSAFFGGRPVAARPAAPGAPVDPGKNMNLYANIAVSLRSDLMRHNAPLSGEDRLRTFLFYRDTHSPDSFRWQGQIRARYETVTERIEDLYYDCNRVRVENSRDPATGDLVLAFFTDGSMANFKAFSLSLDGGKTWSALTGNRYRPVLAGTRQRVLVTPVNQRGRQGCVTTVTITRD